MSWGRRPFTPSTLRENTFTAGIVRLVFTSGRQSSSTAAPWICRRCQSQLAAPSSSTSFTGRIATVDRKPALRPLEQPSRGYASEQAKSKDETSQENGTQDELPSHEEQRRSQITRRFNSVMDNLQANIFFAGQRLNDLTGYSGIEKLKREIDEQERALKAAQERFTQAKHEYTSAIQQRGDSQREVNELLQRKNSWSPTDLERFTSLYRNDHANEQAEQEAQQKLNAAEKASEEAGSKLSAKILRRYHEEQIWSDKIRRMSTWGTWGLMGVNVLLFLVFQIGVEPWRRKRLVRGFEEKVIEALETQKQHSNRVTGEALAALQATHVAAVADGMATSSDAQTQTEEIVEAVVAEELAAETGIDAEELKESTEPSSVIQSWMPDLDIYTAKFEEAFSTQDVTVRQVDLTKRLLEGLFAGVMLTSVVATIIRGR